MVKTEHRNIHAAENTLQNAACNLSTGECHRCFVLSLDIFVNASLESTQEGQKRSGESFGRERQENSIAVEDLYLPVPMLEFSTQLSMGKKPKEDMYYPQWSMQLMSTVTH